MQIFPIEILSFTVNGYLPRTTVRGRIIYAIVLVLLLATLISLPFVRVRLYTTGRGMIKSDIERVPLNSLDAGRVISSYLTNNREVKEGEVLLVLESDLIDEKIKRLQHEIQEKALLIRDLKKIALDPSLNPYLESSLYRKELLQYKEQLYEHEVRAEKLENDFSRSKALLEKGVIAKVEFEDVQLEYNLAINAKNQFVEQNKARWYTDLLDHQQQLRQYNSDLVQCQNQKTAYQIKAPVSGTLINVPGVRRGSTIVSGVSLGEISPTSELIAECYIPPTDIGLITKDQQVQIQVDAFNYNQWGWVEATIVGIGGDVAFVDGQPIYIVRCALEKQQLQLKNGTKGSLQKGMTVTARFQLAERSLYHLLYDKVDDWINPGKLERQKELANLTLE